MDPTHGPSNMPSDQPAGQPVQQPTHEPTGEPVQQPTEEPTRESRSEAGPDHVLIFEKIKTIFSLMICEENRISKKISPQKFWSTKCIKDLTLRLLNLF